MRRFTRAVAREPRDQRAARHAVLRRIWSSDFGGHHYALASYNAGEHRVQRWNEEAPGLPQDEWIDNIPFPETQNYVKRILGTAEDYRRLYGDESITSTVTPQASSSDEDSPQRRRRRPRKRRQEGDRKEGPLN